MKAINYVSANENILTQYNNHEAGKHPWQDQTDQMDHADLLACKPSITFEKPNQSSKCHAKSNNNSAVSILSFNLVYAIIKMLGTK